MCRLIIWAGISRRIGACGLTHEGLLRFLHGLRSDLENHYRIYCVLRDEEDPRFFRYLTTFADGGFSKLCSTIMRDAMTAAIDPANYRSYKGLPTLAGLATLAEAARPGLSVEACVARLKRYHYAFVRLHEIFTARITAEPIYELKTGFSHHAYLCAEHVARPAPPGRPRCANRRSAWKRCPTRPASLLR